MSQHTTRRRALIALGLAATVAFAACGGDDDTPAASGDARETEEETTTTEAPEGEDEGETLEVVGVEYEFQGLSGIVAEGTELTFTNEGEEAHELVLFRINDDETRSAQELLELPEEEAVASVEMKGVAVANPGEDGEVVDGELVVDEAGRYAAVCFIPVGTTSLEDDGDVGDDAAGPPHFTRGMVAEFTVE